MESHSIQRGQGTDVVFCSDNNYLPHCASAVVSLLENEPRVDPVFVIVSGIDQSAVSDFTAHIWKSFQKKVEILEASQERLEKVHTSGHINSSTYLRFMVPELLPLDVQFVLYLDSDLIVTGPFVDLLPLDQIGDEERDPLEEEPALWAVPEEVGGHLREKGFDVEQYFNAGVLFVNVPMWRKERLSQRLFEAEALYREDIVFWDQDVLNIVLAGRWREMNRALNGLWHNRDDATRIVHFSSNRKPWHFGAARSERYLYASYRRKTNFLPYRKEWNTVSFLSGKLPQPVFLLLKVAKNKLMGLWKTRAQ